MLTMQLDPVSGEIGFFGSRKRHGKGLRRFR